jgi:hypothetical protein
MLIKKLEIQLYFLIRNRIMSEVKYLLNLGINVNIYPSFSKAKYQVIDEVYLHIDSDQFEDGSVVMIVISP